MVMKKEKNPLLVFLAGLAMLAAGLYWFASSIHVTSRFGGSIAWGGGFRTPTGLIIVPFIVGIVWLFIDFDSIVAKFIIGIGILIIIAGIIKSTQFYMKSMDLYEYLLMLVFIFGGGALVCKILFQNSASDSEKKEKRKK